MTAGLSKFRLAAWATRVFCLAAIVAAAAVATAEPDQHLPKPGFNERGALLRPEGYREWVYVGAPLTPSSLNPPRAAFPEFHNVYLHPDDFQRYKETGEFPDGTVLVRELVTVGSTEAASGRGYFMGEFTGLAAAVKDSRRFSAEPGHWAYFSFGHELLPADSAERFPTSACNACHAANAAQDWVFTQYYPVLRAARSSGGDASPSFEPMSTHDVHEATCATCRHALRQLAATSIEATGPGGEIAGLPLSSGRLFDTLQRRAYRSWEHHSAVQESKGPHGDAITYVNPTMQEALHGRLGIMPPGAATVMELYQEETHYGWAVGVKTQADSADGDHWYWYEALSTTDPSRLAAAGMGVSLCNGCHSLGRDFVLVNYPLR